MPSSVTLNPSNTSIITMNGIKEQSVLKLAPDMFCTIRDSSTMTIVANDLTALEKYKKASDIARGENADVDNALGGIFYGATQTYFKKGVTSLSTDTSVDGQGSASISIVCPYYEDAQSYYVTLAEGTRVHSFHSMQEVQVYAKGRFTRRLESGEEVPVYYRVFWGVIDDINEDLNGHTASFTLQCKDLLYFWQHEYMNIASTVDPFTLALNGNQVSAPFNASWGPLAGLNSWEIVATMFLNPAIYGKKYTPYGGIKTPDIASTVSGDNPMGSVRTIDAAGAGKGPDAELTRKWSYLGRSKSMMDIWWSRISSMYLGPGSYKKTKVNGRTHNTVDVDAKTKLLPDFLEVYGVYGHRLIERTSVGGSMKKSAGMTQADIDGQLQLYVESETKKKALLTTEGRAEGDRIAAEAAKSTPAGQKREEARLAEATKASQKAAIEAQLSPIKLIIGDTKEAPGAGTGILGTSTTNVARQAQVAPAASAEKAAEVKVTPIDPAKLSIARTPFTARFEFVDPMSPDGESTTYDPADTTKSTNGKNIRQMAVESALDLRTDSNPAGFALFRVRIVQLLSAYQDNSGYLTVDAETYAAKMDKKFSRDMSVFESYQPYTNMKNPVNNQSDFKSRYDIVKKAATDIGFEFFQDVNGNIVFKPPFFNADTSGHKAYVLEPGDIINFSESENGNSVINYVEVRLPWLNSGLDSLKKTGLYYDLGSMAKYGIRQQTIELPMSLGKADAMSDVEPLDILACVHCSLSNAEVRTATVTMPLRPELRAGYPIYIHHLDCFYYIKQVSHSFSPDGSAQTTLTMSAKRERVRYFNGGDVGRNKITPGVTLQNDAIMEGYVWKLAKPGEANDEGKRDFNEFTELNRKLLTNNSPVSWNFEDTSGSFAPIFNAISNTTTELQNSAWSNINKANRPEYLEYLTQRSIEHGLQTDSALAYKYRNKIFGSGAESESNKSLRLTHFTKDSRPFTDRSGFAHIGGLPFGADIQIVDPENRDDKTTVVTPSDLYARLGKKK